MSFIQKPNLAFIIYMYIIQICLLIIHISLLLLNVFFHRKTTQAGISWGMAFSISWGSVLVGVSVF